MLTQPLPPTKRQWEKVCKYKEAFPRLKREGGSNNVGVVQRTQGFQQTLVITHGHHFFRRGGEEFFSMSTWVKNGYRGGDAFGCHSLGEEGGKGGGKKIFIIKKNNCFLLNKKDFSVIC